MGVQGREGTLFEAASGLLASSTGEEEGERGQREEEARQLPVTLEQQMEPSGEHFSEEGILLEPGVLSIGWRHCRFIYGASWVVAQVSNLKR